MDLRHFVVSDNGNLDMFSIIELWFNLFDCNNEITQIFLLVFYFLILLFNFII